MASDRTILKFLLVSVFQLLYGIRVANGQTPTEESPQCKVSPLNPEQGKTVKLTCTSQGGNPPAQLTWLRAEDTITGQMASTNMVDRNVENGVEYRCRLEHPNLPDPKFCSVIPLRKPPTVSIEPSQVTDRVGQGALFTCEAEGIPEISMIRFFFDNVDVTMRPDNNRFLVSGSENSRTLTIRNVIASDNNVMVRCDASIPSGLSASASGLLRIIGETDATTNVPYLNMTTDPTDDAYIGSILRADFFIIIIVIGTIIGQILMVILVFFVHRSLKSKRTDKMKMMNMEWKGVTKSQRGAHEIVPALANMTAPRRYTKLDTGDVAQSRYQDLERNTSAPPVQSSEMEMGVYEGFASSPTSEPRIPSDSSAPRNPNISANSPRRPPPRTSPVPSETRLPSTNSPKASSKLPAKPPPRASPTPRVPKNVSDNVYQRPTSNALSSTFGDSESYQGLVINPNEDYEEPPVEYIEPIAGPSDTVYEVPPDGYVLPDPKLVEDYDYDYELPPTEAASGGYVKV